SVRTKERGPGACPLPAANDERMFVRISLRGQSGPERRIIGLFRVPDHDERQSGHGALPLFRSLDLTLRRGWSTYARAAPSSRHARRRSCLLTEWGRGAWWMAREYVCVRARGKPYEPFLCFANFPLGGGGWFESTYPKTNLMNILIAQFWFMDGYSARGKREIRAVPGE